MIKVKDKGQNIVPNIYTEHPTKAEFDALLVRVTELEKRYRESNAVTKMSNAAKQKAYRARKKITLAETVNADG